PVRLPKRRSWAPARRPHNLNLRRVRRVQGKESNRYVRAPYPYSAYLYSKLLPPRRTASSGSRHASRRTKYKPLKKLLLNLVLSKPTTARLGTTHLSFSRLQYNKLNTRRESLMHTLHKK
ncbi:unnamed protein product, partial [Ectocarpus sp. 6 AP-2014]